MLLFTRYVDANFLKFPSTFISSHAFKKLHFSIFLRFTPMDLVNHLSQKHIKLGMVVDFTNTYRYYNPKVCRSKNGFSLYFSSMFKPAAMWEEK